MPISAKPNRTSKSRLKQKKQIKKQKAAILSKEMAAFCMPKVPVRKILMSAKKSIAKKSDAL